MMEKSAVVHVDIVSRGNKRGQPKTRSAHAAGAYLTGEKIGEFDESAKASEVVYTQVFAPDGSPPWVYDWRELWKQVEQVETRRDAQLARSIYFPLPPELERSRHIAILEDYAREFVKEGMIAQVALHDDGTGKPNGHLLLTMRLLNSDGTWAPKATFQYALDEHGERIKLSNGRYKTQRNNITTWDNRGNVEKWRKNWATIVNTQLELARLPFRVDHRSNERRGIKKIPTEYLSPPDYQKKQQGIQTEAGDTNRLIADVNQCGEAIERLFAQYVHETEILKRKRQLSPQQKNLIQYWDDLHNILRQQKALGESMPVHHQRRSTRDENNLHFEKSDMDRLKT